MRRLFLVLCLAPLCSSNLLCQEPCKNSDELHLHGSVHKVLTEYYLPDGARTGESTLVIYDPYCYRVEEYRYEEDGRLHSHTKYTRDGWRVYKTETTSAVPEENRTFTMEFNERGQVKETDTYNGSGVLISKTKSDFLETEKGEAEVSTVESADTNGTVTIEKTETFATTNASTGVTRQRTIVGGVPHSDWLIRRDSKGNVVADAISYSDGSYDKREVKPDGTTVEERFYAPTKTRTYQTTDANGNVLEVVDETPGIRTRTAFRYDKSGRRTAVANYDASGKLIRKNISEYDDDSTGNWTEQRDSNWDSSMGSKPPKPGAVIRRIITYY